jgi:hypothetical protein
MVWDATQGKCVPPTDYTLLYIGIAVVAVFALGFVGGRK